MKKYVIILLLFSLFIFSCDMKEVLSVDEQVSQVSFTLNGLNVLGATHQYEAWMLYDSLDIELSQSLGIIDITSDGQEYDATLNVPMGLIQKSKAIIVTIEQKPPLALNKIAKVNPSSFVVLAAKFVANNGTFSVGDEFLLGHDFPNASANYEINTPTDPSMATPRSGIWFVNYDTTITETKDDMGNIIDRDTTITQMAGLDLPDLPSGWTYEGWVDFGGTLVSTGKFTSAMSADDENPYSGAGTAYPFPGEDFLQNAPAGITFPTDLAGKEVMIKLTPSHPEGSNQPYEITAFKVTIPSNVASGEGNIYKLENNYASFPKGTLNLITNIY